MFCEKVLAGAVLKFCNAINKAGSFIARKDDAEVPSPLKVVLEKLFAVSPLNL